jgi:hypothetical protein
MNRSEERTVHCRRKDSIEPSGKVKLGHVSQALRPDPINALGIGVRR